MHNVLGCVDALATVVGWSRGTYQVGLELGWGGKLHHIGQVGGQYLAPAQMKLTRRRLEAAPAGRYLGLSQEFNSQLDELIAAEQLDVIVVSDS